MKTLLGLDQHEMLVKTALTETILNDTHSTFKANVTKRVLLLGIVDTERGFEKLPISSLSIAENYFREVPLADFSILSVEDFRDENTTYSYVGLRTDLPIIPSPFDRPYEVYTAIFRFNEAYTNLVVEVLENSLENEIIWSIESSGYFLRGTPTHPFTMAKTSVFGMPYGFDFHNGSMLDIFTGYDRFKNEPLEIRVYH